MKTSIESQLRETSTALIAVKVIRTIACEFFAGCILAIPVASWWGNHTAAAWLTGVVFGTSYSST